MFRILATSAAKRQIKEIARWWVKNRPAAPFLFEEELAEAQENLIAAPLLGLAFPLDGLAGVRRLLLRETRYHLYYTIDAKRGILHLRAVWHASRGMGPWIR